MANSPSAKKRIRQNAKSRARNRWRAASYRDAIKDYQETILHGSVEKAEEELTTIYKLLDRSASKGVLKKNAAARHKSRLASKLNHKRAGVKA